MFSKASTGSCFSTILSHRMKNLWYLSLQRQQLKGFVPDCYIDNFRSLCFTTSFVMGFKIVTIWRIFFRYFTMVYFFMFHTLCWFGTSFTVIQTYINKFVFFCLFEDGIDTPTIFTDSITSLFSHICGHFFLLSYWCSTELHIMI